jgi:hypothetical protein
MNCIVNRIFSFAFLTFLIGGAAATASAQQASFHLPVEARWGALVLPPGDYSVRLPEPALGRHTVSVQGPAVGFVVVMTADAYGNRIAAPRNDYLQLVKVDDVYYVTKYEEASRVTTLYFKAPKQPHPERMASQNVINIPVKRS